MHIAQQLLKKFASNAVGVHDSAARNESSRQHGKYREAFVDGGRISIATEGSVLYEESSHRIPTFRGTFLVDEAEWEGQGRVDTGKEHCLISESFANRIDLKPSDPVAYYTLVGNHTVRRAVLPHLSLEDRLILENVEVDIVPFSEQARLDFVIGRNVFDAARVALSPEGMHFGTMTGSRLFDVYHRSSDGRLYVCAKLVGEEKAANINMYIDTAGMTSIPESYAQRLQIPRIPNEILRQLGADMAPRILLPEGGSVSAWWGASILNFFGFRDEAGSILVVPSSTCAILGGNNTLLNLKLTLVPMEKLEERFHHALSNQVAGVILYDAKPT